MASTRPASPDAPADEAFLDILYEDDFDLVGKAKDSKVEIGSMDLVEDLDTKDKTGSMDLVDDLDPSVKKVIAKEADPEKKVALFDEADSRKRERKAYEDFERKARWQTAQLKHGYTKWVKRAGYDPQFNQRLHDQKLAEKKHQEEKDKVKAALEAAETAADASRSTAKIEDLRAKLAGLETGMAFVAPKKIRPWSLRRRL